MTVLGIVLVIGFLAFAYMATSTPSTPQVYADVNTVKNTDHLKWSPTKTHLLVEYGDLQCPACKNYHFQFKNILEKDKSVTDKVTFIYRHFPLPMHSHAQIAAQIAEASAIQGKYYEMIDTIYENQDFWEGKGDKEAKEYFLGKAKELGMDIDKLKIDMDSKAVKDKIDNDRTSGEMATVNSTPTYFLDGKKVDLGSADDLKKEIQALK